MASSTFKVGQRLRWSKGAGHLWVGKRVEVVEQTDSLLRVRMLEVDPNVRVYRVGSLYTLHSLAVNELLETGDGLLDI